MRRTADSVDRERSEEEGKARSDEQANEDIDLADIEAEGSPGFSDCELKASR